MLTPWSRPAFDTLLRRRFYPPVVNAECELQSFEIPVTMTQGRAVAHLRINGTETPLTLDSGAFFSALTDAAAAQLNLKSRAIPGQAEFWGITGRINYRVARVERLSVQKSELKNIDFLIGGNEPGAGTMGLLGRNILNIYGDTEYDLANGVVRLMTPNRDCAGLNLAYWAESAPVIELPLISHGRDKVQGIKTEASINGKKIEVMFDTGARSIVSLDAAKRAGLLDDEARTRPTGTVFGAGKGERPSWNVPIENFQLGSKHLMNLPMRVADLIDFDADMLIGIEFFLTHRIYVAYSQGLIFFTSNGETEFDQPEDSATTP